MSADTPIYQLTPKYQGLKIAAGIAVIIGALGFFVLLLGSQRHQSLSDSNLEVLLPDGSKMILHDEGNASFNKWLWAFNREVELTGEAFFEVEKGKSFEVIGTLGTAEVLGTSFLVNSTDNLFEVACKTGRVEVTNYEGASVILGPGKCALAENDKLTLRDINISKIPAWVDEDYVFENVPAKELFKTLEEVTGYAFVINADIEMSYSGQFSKSQPIEEILSIICLPMNLNFELKETTIIITNK